MWFVLNFIFVILLMFNFCGIVVNGFIKNSYLFCENLLKFFWGKRKNVLMFKEGNIWFIGNCEESCIKR